MKIITLIVVFYLCTADLLHAQTVLYSPEVGNAASTQFEMIGRVNNYYWIIKSKKNYNPKNSEPWINDKSVSFEVYNERMNKIKTLPSFIAGNTIKEYFFVGNNYLDQLEFINDGGIKISITRYTPDGNIVYSGKQLTVFKGNIRGDDFLFLRSQDKSKNFLLAFEANKDELPKLHTFLYDNNWNVLFENVYEDHNLTQPFVQYDFINYPSEFFDNAPAKLANNGDWLMLSPSRENNNYRLFHFHNIDSSITYNEIKLNKNAIVENLSLSLNNKEGEAFAGVLTNTKYEAVKKAHIAHYILSECRLDFDTTYLFKPIAADKARDENLSEQYFMPVMDKGFMFLKEYGRPYLQNFSFSQENINDDTNNAVDFKNITVAVNENDYTRFSSLADSRPKYDRGDLSFYFFSALKDDSSWSGIINKEQTNDLNAAYLSYICMPLDGKLVFLYNSMFNNDDKYSSTTILDEKGNPLNEGVVFWKAKNTMNFQKARQISAQEVIVPYEKNKWQGFAVIRLSPD